FVRWFLTNLGHVPVRRGARRAAMGALEQGAEVLQNAGAFAIYPEGSRSPDGRLYRGRTGVGWLALETGARVLPVALEGTEKIQPLGASLPRVFGPRPTVRIGPPMDFSHYRDMPPAKARRLIADEIIETIQKMSGQEYVPEYNGGAEASGAGRGPAGSSGTRVAADGGRPPRRSVAAMAHRLLPIVLVATAAAASASGGGRGGSARPVHGPGPAEVAGAGYPSSQLAQALLTELS